MPRGKLPPPQQDEIVEGLGDDGQRVVRRLLDGAASAHAEALTRPGALKAALRGGGSRPRVIRELQQQKTRRQTGTLGQWAVSDDDVVCAAEPDGLTVGAFYEILESRIRREEVRRHQQGERQAVPG